MKKYLIDLDGTLYSGEKPLPFAAEWIDRLNRQGREYLLCTNCSMHSPETLVSRLSKVGIYTTPDHILTSGMAILSILPKGGRIALLGSRAYRNWLEEKKFVISNQASIAVVGFDPEARYNDIKEICNIIREGATYILTNEDNVIPDGDNLIPHTGAFGAAITCATGATPIVLGKPHRPMMQAALDILDCQEKDCIVFGDRLDTDIQFASNHGVESCLLLTGISSSASPQNAFCKPTKTFKNLYEVMKWEDQEG
ncbi:MAG: HAD-IIA family hydrolase [Christensenellales bacterium]